MLKALGDITHWRVIRAQSIHREACLIRRGGENREGQRMGRAVIHTKPRSVCGLCQQILAVNYLNLTVLNQLFKKIDRKRYLQ